MKPMVTVQQRNIIRSVRGRWLEQYKKRADNETLGWDATRTFGQVRAALNALDLETCQPSAIDKALGSTGWADNKCDQCRKSFPVLLRIGDEPDYEARYQELCLGCLETAVMELGNAEALP